METIMVTQTQPRMLFSAFLVTLITHVCAADVQEFFDFEQWENAAGDFTFIGFTEYPQGTILTDQYADLGVTFPEANAVVVESDFSFEDGHGIFRDTPSGFDNIWMEFEKPMTGIAVDFPGGIQIELFSEGQSIALSSNVDPDSNFFGLLSNETFDKARIFDPGGETFIDNLYFAPPIPAPGVLGGFAIAALCFHRRRRR